MLGIVSAEPDRQADPLKCSVICPLRHTVIGKRSKDLFRHSLPAGQVIHSDGATVDGNAEEKNVEICRFTITVDPALGEVYTAPRLKIQRPAS